MSYFLLLPVVASLVFISKHAFTHKISKPLKLQVSAVSVGGVSQLPLVGLIVEKKASMAFS